MTLKKLFGGKKMPSVVLNAPAILIFAGICVLVRILDMITGGGSNRVLFSVYGSSLADPLTYVRCFSHVFGHADWNHLINNMMYILILGPILEEKYGTRNTVIVMAVTAVITGIFNMLLFPGTRLLGASGIVFAFILLASVTSVEEGEIPLSFILVAVLYIGQQIWQGITSADNISQFAHIIGGIVGSVLGFTLSRTKTARHI